MLWAHCRTSDRRLGGTSRRLGGQAHSGLVLGGGPDPLLDLPGECGHQTGRRQDSVWVGPVPLPFQELTGQGVGLNVAGPRSIGEGKVEPGKEECPSGLAGVQSLGGMEVFKVFMVRPYQKRQFSPLEPVPPFFQRQLDGEELTVPNVIISLCRGQTSGVEGTGVQLLVGGRFLGQDGPHSQIGSVHLNHELPFRVRHLEDGCRGEACLQGLKRVIGGRGPEKRHLGGGKSCEGGRHRTVAPDEPPVEVGETQEPLKLLAGIRGGPSGDGRNLG